MHVVAMSVFVSSKYYKHKLAARVFFLVIDALVRLGIACQLPLTPVLPFSFGVHRMRGEETTEVAIA